MGQESSSLRKYAGLIWKVWWENAKTDYIERIGPDWVKIKNRSYSQVEGRHELLTENRKISP
jgi:hypothetical protein